METDEATKSITLRIPQYVFDWLDENHWSARTSRSGYAAKLLVDAVEAGVSDHAEG